MDPSLLGQSLRPGQASAILGASGMGNNVGTLTGNLPALHLLPADTNAMNFNLVPSFSSSSSSDDDDEEEDDHRAHGNDTESNDLPLGSSSSDGEEWGTIRGGNFHMSLSSSSADSEVPKSFELFVPDSKFQLSSLQTKPPLPYLSKEALEPGCTVWTVDEDDVKTILGINWDAMYHSVCNGRQSGIVRRHSGDLTLVEYRRTGVNMIYTLSVPRCCLSLKAIAPYDSAPQSDCNIMSSGYGALGPRSNGRSATVKSGPRSSGTKGRGVHQQLYEAPSLFKLSSNNHNADLVAGLELFLQGNFKEAATKLESTFDTLTTSQERADFYTLRSRLRIFQGQGSEALEDAKECCRLEPQWIRGYLCAARAHSYVGDYKAADAMICQANMLLPNSAALQTVESLNRFMAGVAQTVQKEGHAKLAVGLDERYRKRLTLQEDVSANAPLWSEDVTIASTLSLFDVPCSNRCMMCFAPADDTLASSNSAVSPLSDALLPSNDLFCSEICRHRSSLLALERKHINVVEAARALLRNKAASTVNTLPLELANLTIRLFFTVQCMHHRLGSQARRTFATGKSVASSLDPLEMAVGRMRPVEDASQLPSSARQISLDAVLQRFNVYPLVSDLESTRRDRGLLQLLYDTIAPDLKEEDKQLFDIELFERLYDYVYTYFVNVELPTELPGRPLHVFLVGSLVSAVCRCERPTFKYHVAPEEDAIPTSVGHGGAASVQHWQSSEEGAPPENRTPNCRVRHSGSVVPGVTGDTVHGEGTGSPLPQLQGVRQRGHNVVTRTLCLTTTGPVKAGEDLCLPPFEVDLT